MKQVPKNFQKTIITISKLLEGKQYAIRGTASLVLQDIDMNADDIDIIADRDTSLLCNEVFSKYLVEKVKYKKSDKFKSYYGKFDINSIQVEIMGCMQIKNKKGKWNKPFDASSDEIKTIKFDNQLVKVTKPETELKMFSLMGRWNAFHKIKRQIEKQNQIELSI